MGITFHRAELFNNQNRFGADPNRVSLTEGLCERLFGELANSEGITHRCFDSWRAVSARAGEVERYDAKTVASVLVQLNALAEALKASLAKDKGVTATDTEVKERLLGPILEQSDEWAALESVVRFFEAVHAEGRDVVAYLGQ